LLAFQSATFKKYPLIFGDDKPKSDINEDELIDWEDDEEGTEQTKEKKNYKSPRELFAEKWSWYPLLLKLANNDWMRIDEVVKQPLEDCLIQLSYLREVVDLENYEQAMEENKNRNKTRTR
jgi:hypothetical protein